MRVLLSRICMLVIIALVLTFLYFGFKAYFLVSIGENGQMIDGLGRELYETPALISLFLRISSWPGLTWQLIDTGSFLLMCAVIGLFAKISSYLNK